jgi:hypothetical protein
VRLDPHNQVCGSRFYFFGYTRADVILINGCVLNFIDFTIALIMCAFGGYPGRSFASIATSTHRLPQGFGVPCAVLDPASSLHPPSTSFLRSIHLSFSYS